MECRKNYVASKLSALGFQMWMHLCCKPNSECCTAMYCNTNCITTLPYQIAIIYFILALSLRINWRASVNLLIDQKSQLWCQHCISSPWHMLNCFSSNLRVWCLIASPNPHLQQSILVVCVCARAWFVTQNQLESQCKSAHWPKVSALVPTLFFVTVTHAQLFFSNLRVWCLIASSNPHFHNLYCLCVCVRTWFVTQNQLESQCKSAHWPKVSALVPTLFFVTMTHAQLFFLKSQGLMSHSKSKPPPSTIYTGCVCVRALGLSLRINWRASVNLLIDQKSQLWCQHCFSSPWHMLNCFFKSQGFMSHSKFKPPPSTIYTGCVCVRAWFVTQNQLESQCKSAHWPKVSALVPTLFIVAVTHAQLFINKSQGLMSHSKSKPPLSQSILVVCVCACALGLSLRINWRASVNLLIDQKSQLWCQHCFSSPWHMLNCFFKSQGLMSHSKFKPPLSQSILLVCVCACALGLSLRINWRASVNLLIDQKSQLWCQHCLSSPWHMLNCSFSNLRVWCLIASSNPHFHNLYCLCVCACALGFSLRINWRASVNLLIDQKSQLWCQHCLSSPWHMLNCSFSNLRVWCLIASSNPHFHNLYWLCVCVRARLVCHSESIGEPV